MSISTSSSSWTVRISGYAEPTFVSSITVEVSFLGVNELELLSQQISSFVVRLTLFEACDFVSWLPSIAQVITKDKNDSRIISFDNYSHVAKILNTISCLLTSQIFL